MDRRIKNIVKRILYDTAIPIIINHTYKIILLHLVKFWLEAGRYRKEK
jgi:hypothetical protein